MKLPEPIRALFDALRRLWRWIWDPWLNWLAGLPLSRKLINWVEARPRVHAGVTWLGRYWAYIALPLLAVLFSVKAVSLSRLVDDRLAEGVFANTTNVYAAPSLIGKGDATTPRALADSLIESGYSDIASNPVGYFRLYENSIEIHPGPQSYFEREPARVTFNGGKISEIRAIQTGETSNDLLLEPVLLANLSGEARERRRLVRYADLPPDLIHAVLSIEDKHFFEHHGFDLLRILKSVLVNLRSGRKEQGGSTLTMQFARNIWLGSEKTWSRKFDEALITIILELRLKKEEILELYANQVYLGQRDTFALHGFGEASQAFFNKEAKRLTLPEAALLAGIIQRPSAFDPIRHPEEATERRNTVLALMHRNEYITEDQMRAASAAPLGLSPRIGDAEVA
ncbi:MAG: transglycosylase domain-containing protein, partial [Bryobacterales bacterium]|nr:transglycosylase domain-containing protein [Bryobacterales bacterium]